MLMDKFSDTILLIVEINNIFYAIGGIIMTISLNDFLQQLSNPALFITVVLILGVILVNGWTDTQCNCYLCIH